MVCDGRVPNQYVLHWTDLNMDAIKLRANGTTFMEISKANFRPMPILVPPPNDLGRFQEIANAQHRLVVGCVRESETLAEVRDTLLPKLISGAIRVPDTADLDEVIGPAAEALGA